MRERNNRLRMFFGDQESKICSCGSHAGIRAITQALETTKKLLSITWLKEENKRKKWFCIKY